MYIFIKIHDGENGKGEKPFIIDGNNLELVLDTVCEKYYGFKFSSVITVIHYPIFLNVLNTIKRL